MKNGRRSRVTHIMKWLAVIATNFLLCELTFVAAYWTAGVVREMEPMADLELGAAILAVYEVPVLFLILFCLWIPVRHVVIRSSFKKIYSSDWYVPGICIGVITTAVELIRHFPA